LGKNLDLDDILKRLNMEDFLLAQGLQVNKKKGDKWNCTCPLCGDKKRFAINLAKGGAWICNGCKETGNIITLYAKIHGCTNGVAVAAIKKFAGIEDDPPAASKKAKSPKKTTEKTTDSTTKRTKEPDQSPNPPNNSQPAISQPVTHFIYQRFLQLVSLRDEHRAELKKKRGFTDSIIDELRFVSAGPDCKHSLEVLRTEFSEEDLVASGIFVRVNNNLVINQQLLEDRVIIPYIDPDGNPYHLKPHKLGFKGLDSQVYCSYLLKLRPQHIVITEGEFKAAALYQWGIPAVAVPGTANFIGKNFERLVTLLTRFGVKRVTVIFDNEIKDNPSFPNFKERIEKRYDTQSRAYILAYKLNQNGIETNIGNLPDEWREQGKVDFDMALAQGRSKKEIEIVIRRALLPKEYLDSLAEEAKKIVRRNVNKHFFKSPVSREFNKYVIKRTKTGGETWDETISNFVIDIKSSFFTPEGVVRNVEFVNEHGEKSGTFPLDPGEMAGLNEFKKFCFSKGNYVFEGDTKDLLHIWKLEFSRDSGELIYMPDRIGKVEKGLWLFGNLAIKDGTVYRPDNDGIVWIDGKGYKPQSLQIGPRGEAMEDAIPGLYDKDVDIDLIARTLFQSVGGYTAYMGIGWVVATIFSEDIFAKYKCLPILWPHGKRESGKSTFARWLMNFFGVETEGIGLNKTTTQNFIARILSYRSSLGVWFDEYRNEAEVTNRDGFFRSAYNRQLSGKGTATAFQAKGFVVNATLVISGEELPRDNGLFTRCIPLQISSNRRDRTVYETVNRLTSKFSGFTYHLLLNYDRYRDKILENIAALKDALVQLDVSDRTAENWAICAGAFEATVFEDDGFIAWVEKACQEIKRTGEEEHMLNQFWEDLNYLYSRRELNSQHFRVEGDVLYVWFNGCYDSWCIHFRKKTGREPFDKQSIQKYLEDEKYYLGRELKRMGGGPRRVLMVDIENATETIRELALTVGESGVLEN